MTMKLTLLTLLITTGAVLFTAENSEEPNFLFHFVYLNSSYQSCMGALIAPQWVLTAAHCFLPNLQVIFRGGSRNFQEFTGEFLSYEKIITHPNFTATSPNNDLMLIKLSSSSIYYPTQNYQLASHIANELSSCFVYIWLDSQNPREIPDTSLYHAEIVVNSVSDCELLLLDHFQKDLFCVGFQPGGYEKCQVVSASTVMCDGKIQGILSWGTGCLLLDYVNVFTEISHHVPWIKTVISTQ